MVSEVTPSSNIAAGITSNTDLDPHSMYMYYCNAYREKIRTNISIRVLPNPTLFYLVLLVVLLGMFLQKPNRFDREQQKRSVTDSQERSKESKGHHQGTHQVVGGVE